MLIVGMTGPIGHGKSTFAESLDEIEPSTFRLEFSTVIIDVANAMHDVLSTIPPRDDLDAINNWLRALPAILLQTLGVKATFEQICLDAEQVQSHPIEYEKLFLHLDNLAREPILAKQNIIRANKEAYRPFLQWLGGHLVEKVDTAIWQKEVIKRIQQARREGYKLCVVGGLRYPEDATALRNLGAKIIKVYRPGHLQYDMLDPTERERGDIIVDATIMSNGGVEDVRRCAAQVYRDLQSDTLEGLYQTKLSV